MTEKHEKQSRFRVEKILGVSLGAGLLVLATLFGLAQTETAKKQIIKGVTALLSQEDRFEIDISGLKGIIPFAVELDRVTVGDQRGIWLTAEKISLHWSPFKLLRRRLFIENLGAEYVSLKRIPEAAQEPSDRSDGIPQWPGLLDRLSVTRMWVERLEVGEPIMGEAVTFQLDGFFRSERKRGDFSSSIHLDRVDEDQGKGLFEAVLTGQDQVLDLCLEWDEGLGVLIGRLLGLKQGLNFSLKGRAPLMAWRGTLEIASSDLGRVESDVAFDGGAAPLLTWHGTFLFPNEPGFEEITAYVGPEIFFDLELHPHMQKNIHLFTLNMKGEESTLNLTGSLDLNREFMDGHFVLAAADLESLGSGLGFEVMGKGDAEGKFSGPFLQPEISVDVILEGLEAETFGASSLVAQFELTPHTPFGMGIPEIELKGKGRLDNPRIKDWKGFRETEISWNADIYGPVKDRIEITRVHVEGDTLSLKFSGEVQNLFTKAALSAQIGGSIDLTGDPEDPLIILLGEEISYQGELRFENAHLLFLEAVQVKGRAGALFGETSIDLKEQTIQGGWTLDLPQLDPMASLLDLNMKGSFKGEGNLQGHLNDMMLEAVFTGRGVHLDDKAFDPLQVALHCEGLPLYPKGDLEVTVTHRGQDIAGKTDFVLQRNRFQLTSLSTKGLGLDLTGDFNFDIEPLVITGEIKGQFESFSGVSSLLGQAIEGRGAFGVIFENPEGVQTVSFRAEASGVSGPWGQAGDLVLDGTVRSPFERPEGRLNLELKSLQENEIQPSFLSLRVEGNLNRIAFEGETQGDYGRSFRVTTSGDLALSDKLLTLDLKDLKGEYGDLPFNLVQPVAIRLGEEELDSEEILLTLGRGRLTAQGGFDREEVRINLEIEAMPLAPFLGQEGGLVDGTAMAQIRVTGKAKRPSGHASIELKGLRYHGSELVNAPPSSIKGEARLENETLSINMMFKTPPAAAVEADMTFPIAFSLYPLVWSLPTSGPLKGNVTGNMDLSKLSSQIGLDDHVIEGELDLALELEGTIDDPVIRGGGWLKNGSYENLRSGTILKDISVELDADSLRLLIKNMRAGDGEKGKIMGEGWIEASPAKGFPLELHVNLNQARLFRHDYGTGILSGDVMLSGSLKEAVLHGQVEIGNAEFQVPRQFSADIVEIEVIEISEKQEEEEQIKKEVPFPMPSIELDLTAKSTGRVFLRGRGLDSEWAGDLKVSGTATEPLINGELSVVRGYFDFLSKRFQITRGEVRFAGSSPPSPWLDFEAESSREEITVLLRVSGPPESLAVTLTSTPVLPEDEILARLLFGRSMSQITPIQALQLADALGVLGGVTGGGQIMGRVRNMLGVDQLEIELGKNLSEDTSIRAGKYLKDNVYLEYKSGTGKDAGKAAVTWDVNPHLAVESEVGVDSEGGLEVRWKWDY
jgi:translocation and assembly module TamB